MEKKTQCLFLKISRGTVRNHTSHQGFQPGSAGAFQHRGAVRCPGAEPLQLLLLLLLLMMLQEEEVDEKDSLIVFTRKITDPHFHLNPTYSRFLLCSLMSSPFFNMRRKRSWWETSVHLCIFSRLIRRSVHVSHELTHSGVGACVVICSEWEHKGAYSLYFSIYRPSPPRLDCTTRCSRKDRGVGGGAESSAFWYEPSFPPRLLLF